MTTALAFGHFLCQNETLFIWTFCWAPVPNNNVHSWTWCFLYMLPNSLDHDYVPLKHGFELCGNHAIPCIKAPLPHLASVDILRPRQNGRQIPGDIFKLIFSNENIGILIDISLKFVPKCLIDNLAALVKIMAWRCPGAKPLSEPMIVYWRIYASHGLNELIWVLPQAMRMIRCPYFSAYT